MIEKKIPSGVVWITGYSAAGKTTISKQLELELCKLDYKTIFLDGDILRNVLGNNRKYDKESRLELAYVYFKLCKELSSQGYIVIISAVVMFDEIFDWVKENIPNSIQIYLKVPRENRKKRDALTKKIFLNTNINKNDELYDEPKNADLVIKNFGENDIIKSTENIKLFFTKYYSNN
jgi:bifunctional enzyme CysN/CysC